MKNHLIIFFLKLLIFEIIFSYLDILYYDLSDNIKNYDFCSIILINNYH